ncbi:MFS transporter [Phytohabitans aurantiacus]|jgi:MFS family permease|uniref:MFS transporter n=1 Tax=Phytohabitans aurantiacus TaxID=3016789 RepID=A0ABQ5R6K2_9ACTN|nr:MFS transporter [Phytohabitans aurantiacus]GLI02389.1 MFS transporter [Phytohabitans aurantiacus]
MVTTTAPPQYLLSARNGVAVVFGLNGLGVASWFARVPAARDALDLSAGRLGMLLLAMSAGAILAMPTSGVITHRLGPRRTVTMAAAIAAAGLAIAGLGGGMASIVVVGLGIFALGYGSGTCDVAMNVEGAAVERRLGRTIMPRFHAAWSLGTVAGAGIGAGAARVGLPLAAHLMLAAGVMLAGTLVAVRSFLAADPEAPREKSGGVLAAWREPRTLLIGLLVLIMAFTEGTANDWLAVAFVDGHGVTEAAGAATFGVFVAAMTTGRTLGTLAIDRWGRVRTLTVTIFIAGAGALIAILANSWAVALAGVALWGVGASLGFPVGMSAAADEEHRAPARVSVVAVIGYTAFLAGPPLVGFLGDHTGTLKALLIVPLILLPALALVPATRRQPAAP